MAILSIQSHVAFGHVGNAAATFPLQRLGFDVWPVHTVMFSNHTGYEDFAGPVIAAPDIRAVIDGMARRGALAECEAVLSGYLGSAAIGTVVRDTVRRIRAGGRDVIYVCDPVIGDTAEGVYVAADIPDMLRDELLPLADLALPNQFELELLTGRPAGTLSGGPPAAVAAAARELLARSPCLRAVVVTSVEHRDTDPATIEMFAVGTDGAWRVATPRLPFVHPLSGAGDAVSALFTGHYLRTRGDVAAALGLVAGAVYAVLAATVARRRRELALVAAQDALLDPPTRFTVTQVD